MRGRRAVDSKLADFVAARSAELHRTAYLLAADQQRAVLLLRSVEGFDRKSTGRELQLKQSIVQVAEQSACESLGFEADSAYARTALTDFAGRADWPDAGVTLASASAARLPHRPRWRYAAAVVVIVATLAVVVGAQVQHDRWLRTPEGINASHGTHFHAYTQGFELVGVQEVPPGGKRRLDLPFDDVIAISCEHFSPRQQDTWPQLDSVNSQGAWACDQQSAHSYFLTAPYGRATVTAPRTGGSPVKVAIYRPVPWAEYPVARSGFEVEHDRTLDGEVEQGMGPRVGRGRALTMTGTNGVFTATLERPPSAGGTTLFLSGLLSPTTTGQYRVDIDGQPATYCSEVATGPGWCRVHDKYIPQVSLSTPDANSASPGPVSIRVEVRDALGPWKLELRYDRYRVQN